MGAPKKADWREERRKRAWKLKEDGWQQKAIAVALGVSEGAVSRLSSSEGEKEAKKPSKRIHPKG
jgi:predicted transcriptional regulator